MGVLLIQKHDLTILLGLQALHEFTEGICSGKVLLVAQVSRELHSLHQVAHPLFAEVAVGKTILKQLPFQLKTYKEVVLLAVASNFVNILD